MQSPLPVRARARHPQRRAGVSLVARLRVPALGEGPSGLASRTRRLRPEVGLGGKSFRGPRLERPGRQPGPELAYLRTGSGCRAVSSSHVDVRACGVLPGQAGGVVLSWGATPWSCQPSGAGTPPSPLSPVPEDTDEQVAVVSPGGRGLGRGCPLLPSPQGSWKLSSCSAPRWASVTSFSETLVGEAAGCLPWPEGPPGCLDLALEGGRFELVWAVWVRETVPASQVF